MTDRALGKLYVREDGRTLEAARYMPAVPPAPPKADWLAPVGTWSLFGNDRIGDCTFASEGHRIELATADARHAEVTVPDAAVIGAYAGLTGYDPATGANDNGAVLLDALNYQRRVGIAGHRIGAFAKLDHRDHALVRAAIATFGQVRVGASLPLAAEAQVGREWKVTHGTGSAPGSWGGHAITFGAYSRAGLECVTWAELQPCTWGWWNEYVDEAYVVLGPDWLDAAGHDPHGLDVAALTADLAAL